MMPGITASGRPVSAPTPPGFPEWLSVTGSISIGGTSHVVDLPATVDPGDILIIQFSNDGFGENVQIPADFTLLDAVDIVSAGHTWCYKVADGDEGGTTVTFTTNSSEDSAAQVVRIAAGTYSGAPEISSIATGSSDGPAPPALSPAGGAANYLWLVMMGAGGNLSGLTYPYPDGNDAIWSGGSIGAEGAVASCYVEEDAATLTPGTFGGMASQPWAAATIAINPA